MYCSGKEEMQQKHLPIAASTRGIHTVIKLLNFASQFIMSITLWTKINK